MKSITICFMITLFCITPLFGGDVRNIGERPQILVNGDAKVYVQPDTVVITLGIDTLDMDIMVAKEKSNSILKETISAIKDLKVIEKDIQTDQLSITPRYSGPYERDFAGYFVKNRLMVTLTDIEILEALVTQVLLAGVNRIQGIEFRTTEFKRYREKARGLALKAAREKAEKMAGILGQSIGDPIKIEEKRRSDNIGEWAASNSMRDYRNDFPGTSGAITFGKIVMHASIEVTFELK